MASDQTKTRPPAASGTKKMLAVAALATELRDGVMRFNRRLRQARPVGDLTQSQLSVLTSLELAGALTPRELAESERVQPPTMTKTVARLEEIGLVQRTPHPTDGRQVILSATPRGREALAENRRARDAWLTKRLAALSDAERDTLRAAIEIITRIARDGTPDTPPH
jgi:DNA-binding MarR family transcriptional regulator